jgi:Ca2+/Na+ antiporter
MLESEVLDSLVADQKSAHSKLQRAYRKANITMLLPTIVVVGSIIYFNMTWWIGIIFSLIVFNVHYFVSNKYIVDPAKKAEQLAANAYIDYIHNDINSQIERENSN